MSTIDNQYKKTQNDILARVAKAENLSELNELRIAVLGKNGEFTAILKSLKDVPVEQKAAVGKQVNDIKVAIEESLAIKQKAFEEIELAKRLVEEKIDISIDKPQIGLGALHPINQTKQRISDFFISMGFLVADSPEIETEYYNFEALNTPSDHPARDTQDTFFVGNGILLRSQTSSGQIRLMQSPNIKPPIKLI